MENILRRNYQDGKIVVECKVPNDKSDTRIQWTNKGSVESFVLKFKVDGTFYYQHLIWMCRAGKPSYYKTMVELYRYLVKHGLVQRNTLRSLASASAVLELRLNGSVIKRGSDTLIHTIFHQVSVEEGVDPNVFEERREAWRNTLNVPRWDGLLEVFRLRSAYSPKRSTSAWHTALVTDSRDLMDFEAIRRIEQGAKYGNPLWASTAASVLRRRFGSDDPALLQRLIHEASNQPDLPQGSRQQWIKVQVATMELQESCHGL